MNLYTKNHIVWSRSQAEGDDNHKFQQERFEDSFDSGSDTSNVSFESAMSQTTDAQDDQDELEDSDDAQDDQDEEDDSEEEEDDSDEEEEQAEQGAGRFEKGKKFRKEYSLKEEKKMLKYQPQGISLKGLIPAKAPIKGPTQQGSPKEGHHQVVERD